MALAVLAVMACGSDVAAGDPGDMIVTATIYKPGASPTTQSITSGSLTSRPAQCPVYGKSEMDEYDRQGKPNSWPIPPSRTWSLATILGCLQSPIQASDVTAGVTVFDAGSPESGPDSTLTSQDLAPSSDFNDPTESPVVSDLGTSRQYNRPWRGGSDENLVDQVTETGGPIAISVFEGHPIQVSASAAPAAVTAGATVSFSASASGSGLSYQWSFGGGAPPSTQQNPQVTFATAGVWTVSLLVTDDNGDAGHTQLTETVTAAGPTTSTTPTTPQTVTTGPTQSAGTTPGGTAGGTHGGTGSPAHKPKHRTTGSPAPSGKPTGQRKTTTHTSTTQTSTTPAGSGTGSGPNGSSGSGSGSGSTGSGSGSSGFTGAGAPSSATTPASTSTTPHVPKAPRTTSHPAPPASGATRLITGELISDVVPVPESASPLVHAVAASAARATAPPLHPPSGPSALPIIGSVLAILVLLGAGAQRELGLLRRWVPRRLPLRARA